MNYRKLGNSGVRVSEITLGSMFFGGAQYKATDNPVTEEEAKMIINKAIDLDINHLDCADIYGAYGNAEKILGKSIKGYDRDHLIISSKVMLPMSRNELDRGLSRKHVKKSISRSLDRMATDYIDLYYCHRYDHLTPLFEIVVTMNNLIEEGKIHYWGTSNWSPAELERAMSIAKQYGFQGPVVDQTKYNLNRRYPVEVALPYTLDTHDIGIAAYKILGGGTFTSKYTNSNLNELSDKDKNQISSELPQTNVKLTQQYLDKISKFNEIASNLDITAPQLAYAMVLISSNVSTAITSTRSPDRLEENVVATNLTLKQETIDEVNQLFPVESSYYNTYSYVKQQVNHPRVPGKISEDMMKF